MNARVLMRNRWFGSAAAALLVSVLPALASAAPSAAKTPAESDELPSTLQHVEHMTPPPGYVRGTTPKLGFVVAGGIVFALFYGVTISEGESVARFIPFAGSFIEDQAGAGVLQFVGLGLGAWAFISPRYEFQLERSALGETRPSSNQTTAWRLAPRALNSGGFRLDLAGSF